METVRFHILTQTGFFLLDKKKKSHLVGPLGPIIVAAIVEKWTAANPPM